MTVIQNYKWSILSWSNVSIEIDFSCPDPHPQLCWKCHTTHVGRQCFLKWERFLIVSQLVHIWDITHTGRTFPTKVVSAMSWRCGSGFSMINFSSVRVREVYLLLNYTCVEFMGRKKIVHRDWTKRKTCWISVQVLQCLFFPFCHLWKTAPRPQPHYESVCVSTRQKICIGGKHSIKLKPGKCTYIEVHLYMGIHRKSEDQ